MSYPMTEVDRMSSSVLSQRLKWASTYSGVGVAVRNKTPDRGKSELSGMLASLAFKAV